MTTPRIIIDRHFLSIFAVVMFMLMVGVVVIYWLFTLNEFNVRSFWAGMTVAFIFGVCVWVIVNAFDRMSDAKHWHQRYQILHDSAQRLTEKARLAFSREDDLLHIIEQAQSYIADPTRRRGYKDQADAVLAEIGKVLNPLPPTDSRPIQEQADFYSQTARSHKNLDTLAETIRTAPGWLARGLEQNNHTSRVKIPWRKS